jgi:hypothetical protein
MTQTQTTAPTMTRDQIATAVSDLRQMRFAIADLQGIAWSMITLARTNDDIPAELREDMEAAIALIDRADKIAGARMVELYHAPTLKAANDIEEEKAA